MQTDNVTFDSGVDLPELLARVEYDRELLQEVFDIFRAEFPQLHLVLKEAVQCSDVKQVQITSHTLKGMLASLSFTKASASAMRIERMARQCAMEGIPEELARLERNIALAELNLEAVCNEVVR